MAFYVAIHPRPDVNNATVWEIDNGIANRVDAKQGPYHVTMTDGEGSFVEPDMRGFKLVPLKIAPGNYYPNIARPRTDIFTETPGISPNVSRNIFSVQSRNGQLLALQERLESIFRTVHPENEISKLTDTKFETC